MAKEKEIQENNGKTSNKKEEENENENELVDVIRSLFVFVCLSSLFMIPLSRSVGSLTANAAAVGRRAETTREN